MRTGAQRRRRESGSALVVAMVLVFITIISVQMLLAIPEAAHMQAKRTIWRDRSLAAADEGVREAAMLLTAHASYYRPGGALYWDTSQTGVNASAPTTKVYTAGISALNATTRSGTTANTATVAGASVFVRFGDTGNDNYGYPLVGYCYAIQNCSADTTQANSYFKVDAWGWAPNPTGDTTNMDFSTAAKAQAAISSAMLANGIDTSLVWPSSITANFVPTPDINPRNLVTHIQVVLYNKVIEPPLAAFAAASMAYPTSLGAPPRFGGTSAANFALPGVGTGMIGVTNPHPGDAAFFGADQAIAGTPATNYGLSIQNPLITFDQGTGTNGMGGLPTGMAPPPGSTTTGSIIGGNYGTTAPASTWTAMDQIVAQTVAAAAAYPNGTTGFNVATWTGNGSTYTPPNLSATTSLTYIKIPDGANVSGVTGPPQLIVPPTGTPGMTGGILIIDVGTAGGAGVTFDASTSIFGALGTHQWNGTVIFYQRSPVNLTNTTGLIPQKGAPAISNTLLFATENGNQSGQAEFDSVKVNTALNDLATLQPPVFKIQSYVIKSS